MQNSCVQWSDAIQLHLEDAILFTWLYLNKDILFASFSGLHWWSFCFLNAMALDSLSLAAFYQTGINRLSFGPSSLTLPSPPHLFQGNSWAVEQWEPGVQPAWRFGLATQRRHLLANENASFGMMSHVSCKLPIFLLTPSLDLIFFIEHRQPDVRLRKESLQVGLSWVGWNWRLARVVLKNKGGNVCDSLIYTRVVYVVLYIRIYDDIRANKKVEMYELKYL